MEKKEASVAEPMGMCEKLFHAVQANTAFRPIRRLTFGRRDQTDATAAADKPHTIPPPPPSFHDSLSSGKNNSTTLTPAKTHKTDDAPKTGSQVLSPAKQVTTALVDRLTPPAKQVTTALVDRLTPPKKANNMAQVEDKVKKESAEQGKVSPPPPALPPVPTPAPTPVVKIVTPTKTTKIEPKDSKKMLLPTPAPPTGSISPQPTPPPTTAENPKKNINEKVEDYIQRARGKFRAGSAVGRAPPNNN